MSFRMLIKKKILPRWYAFAVYTRQEKAAEREIKKKGFEVYLPLKIERRMWSDRVKKIETALFPGYLFVRAELDAGTRNKIIFPKQVWDVVGRTRNRVSQEDEVAKFVPDSQIESLKITLQNSQKYEATDKLIKGVEVKIVSGPLAGSVGIVERELKGVKKVTVQLPLLSRGVKATLGVGEVLAFTELTKSQMPGRL